MAAILSWPQCVKVTSHKPYGGSNHRQIHCLFNNKEECALLNLYEVNPLAISLPSLQRASHTEKMSVLWLQHVVLKAYALKAGHRYFCELRSDSFVAAAHKHCRVTFYRCISRAIWPVTRKMFPFDDVIIKVFYNKLTHIHHITGIQYNNKHSSQLSRKLENSVIHPGTVNEYYWYGMTHGHVRVSGLESSRFSDTLMWHATRKKLLLQGRNIVSEADMWLSTSKALLFGQYFGRWCLATLDRFNILQDVVSWYLKKSLSC